MACEKVEDGTALNLGWDKRYKIKDVASMILEEAGYHPRIQFDRSKPEGPFSRALDISKSLKMLGWKPRVDLEEGLERTVAWHREMRKVAAKAPIASRRRS
jgi:nucleoside-diphosphate-sugar epimerase